MPTFSPLLQEPWQLEIAALYAKLAKDIAAVHKSHADKKEQNEPS